MGELILAVLRRPAGLAALVSPAPGEEHERPLGELRPALLPLGPPLLAAEERLRRATAPPAELAAAALLLAIETLVEPTSAVPAPAARRPPAPPRASAAHPRAYRGTRRRPPRPSTCPADLWIRMSSPAAAPGVLADLGPALPEAAARLGALGYAPDRLLGACAHPGDLAQRYWHGAALPLPWPFRRLFARALRGAPAEELGALLSLGFALHLEARPPLALALARLLARGTGGRSLFELILAERPERQDTLFAALEAAPRLPADVAPLGRLSALSGADTYRARLEAALRLDPGACLEELLAGVELAQELHPAHRFGARTAPRAATAALARLGAALAGRSAGLAPQHGPALLALWSRAAADPRVAELLPPLEALTAARPALHPTSTLALMRLAEQLAAATARVDLPALLAPLATALASAPQGVHARGLALAGALAEEGAPPAAYQRLCQERDRLWAGAGGVRSWARLILSPGPVWQALCAAPGRTWRRLADHARRDNHDWLLARGLTALLARAPALVAASLSAEVTPLLATGRTLGALAPALADRLLAEWSAHPLTRLGPPPEHAAGPEHTAWLAAARAAWPAGLGGILPRALTAHARGVRALSPAQLAGHMARVRQRWTGALLRLTRHLVLASLGRVLLPTGTPAGDRRRRARVEHALLMVPSAEGQRRALRALVQAHGRGEAEAFVWDHPASAAWFRRHPRVDRALWRSGLELTRALAGCAVQLGLEQDPLEVLRLGTLSGTCLGLGGSQSYSAAAIALDVNKRVVFARDERGVVLARQVLALSEGERLCCFAVYPAQKDREVLQLFAEYDRRFAQALGVELACAAQELDEDEGEEDRVAHVISCEWWYDGTWTLGGGSARRSGR